MTDAVGLLGDGGLVHARIAGLLAARTRVVHLDPDNLDSAVPGCAVVVAATDRWRNAEAAAVRPACTAAGVPWLPVSTEPGHLIVGPMTTGARPGCLTCAYTRRRGVSSHPAEFGALWRSQGDRLSTMASRRRTGFAAGVAAELVAAELDAAGVEALGAEPAGRPDDAVWLVGLRDIRVSRHRLLPDPACPECGTAPRDGRAAARFVAQPRPKPATDVYRVRAVAPRDGELRDRYVDAELGLIQSVTSSRTSGPGAFVTGTAVMSARGSGGDHEHPDRYGWGRTFDVPGAELTAILEALERYGAEQPAGEYAAVRGSYRELAADAVDPRTLGLHTDEQYASPGFRFQPYTEDLVLKWVWGWSFSRRRPVLVPRQCAYYAIHDHDDPPIVYDSSNGGALGGCPEEAILHGLLEVAERDAFLMTWYARLPVARIDPASARDRTIPMLIAHLRQRYGHEIRLYDTTLEQGVPTFWAMAVDPDRDPARVQTLCAAGSALVPERGVLSALHELADLLDHRDGGYDAEQRASAGAMVADPYLVRGMSDHSTLYSHDGARARLDFLDGGRLHSFAELAERHWSWPAHTDLARDLDELVGRYLAGGLDVIVVDQTAPEHRPAGLSVVKVLVPGTLPMTFGYRNRRVHGLPRLLTVPHALGYRDRPLTPAEVNPHPHPFP
jgi:ribosomal protein S12 methylthiotransferase accessory factor